MTKLVLIGVAFIFLTLLTAVYANRQIVDLRFEGDAQPLGTNSIALLPTITRYDTNHYHTIVEHGYDAIEVAFFPLYPLVVNAARSVGLATVYALPLVSWLFTIASIIVIFHWARYELRAVKSRLSPYWVIGLFLIFPTSLYLTIGYSESLFIFLTSLSLFAFRKNSYVVAGVAAALASATRVQGVALIVFFLLEYLTSRHRRHIALLPVAMSAIGIGGYMSYLWVTFGNPLAFIAAQRHWGRFDSSFVGNLVSSAEPLHLWYGSVLAVMLYAVYRYLGRAWLGYALVFISLPIASGRFDSLNRYMLAAPILFIALSLWLNAKSELVRLLYIVSSAFLLAWSIVFYFNGYWVG